jgi:Rps23 Pro-64 3,4-dihydroxylase Tpa1-like proline 4-hydroxylase
LNREIQQFKDKIKILTLGKNQIIRRIREEVRNHHDQIEKNIKISNENDYLKHMIMLQNLQILKLLEDIEILKINYMYYTG